MRAAALFCLLFFAGEAKAACYDLSKSEPHVLTGVLSHRIFPGPPGYQDVQRGDQPEPGYLLTLPAPICLTGDDFADPDAPFNEAQLVETDETAKAMRALIDRTVTVELTRPMAAETGHHHRPLVAWVTRIDPIARASRSRAISSIVGPRRTSSWPRRSA